MFVADLDGRPDRHPMCRDNNFQSETFHGRWETLDARAM